MKKTIAILLSLVMVFALCACGNSVNLKNINTNPEVLANSKYVGNWQCTEISFAGESEKPEENATKWIIEVRPDGTLTMDTPDGVQELKWGISNDGFTVISDKGTQFMDNGENGIKMKMLGVEFVFERVAEGAEPATDDAEEPVAEDSTEQPAEEAAEEAVPEEAPAAEPESVAEASDEGVDAVTY